MIYFLLGVSVAVNIIIISIILFYFSRKKNQFSKEDIIDKLAFRDFFGDVK